MFAYQHTNIYFIQNIHMDLTLLLEKQVKKTWDLLAILLWCGSQPLLPLCLGKGYGHRSSLGWVQHPATGETPHTYLWMNL